MVYRDERLKITDVGQKAVTLPDFFSLFVMRECSTFSMKFLKSHEEIDSWNGVAI